MLIIQIFEELIKVAESGERRKRFIRETIDFMGTILLALPAAHSVVQVIREWSTIGPTTHATLVEQL
jgi:hypothetical protein